MSRYHFFYDESEHSRRIGYKTISADNFYDNFVSVIIGWRERDQEEFCLKYEDFERKHSDRTSQGEIKSTTIKQAQLKHGFASLNSENISFIGDFLDVFDERLVLYFCIASKVEFLVFQLFRNYENSLVVDSDAMRYTITKLLLTYRPDSILKCIYEHPSDLIHELELFCKDRLEKNKRNISLKERENKAIEQLILLLQDTEPIDTLDWCYDIPFDGFKKLLQERGITQYSLVIDKEQNTLTAAQRQGIMDVKEADSKNEIGIRYCDLFAGLISKLMKSLNKALSYQNEEEEIRKKLLTQEWFRLTPEQLELYKKLYQIICGMNNDWYKLFSGLFSDDLISMVGLLEYMNQFASSKDIEDIELQGEYFNSYICDKLADYYNRLHFKLPVDIMPRGDREYFLNRQGAIVYYDINKQPKYLLEEGSQHEETVLSIGLHSTGSPMMTVDEGKQIICYLLPYELLEWAETVIGFAAQGEKLFPSEVIFTKRHGKTYADFVI